ncbi:hypothetical protein BWQ96_03947 [Gracilariopsis chorda]|uniref:Uncharacterized protein n=1 Tax=Gracilariopsis chorda TaxID=448386 RepID=A0A2V3IVZ4_9FLOR|nr:hypothetical protein BWQ96_03947 [Gracilariopsis chorda]|eukprot:PXF46291.1 hypothetical protein BWQ96_03947 [Gracilariopsis chorda]
MIEVDRHYFVSCSLPITVQFGTSCTMQNVTASGKCTATLAEHWFSILSEAHRVQGWTSSQTQEFWFAFGIPRAEFAAVCTGNITAFVSCKQHSLEYMHRSDMEFFLTPDQPVAEYRMDAKPLDSSSIDITGSESKRQLLQNSHFCIVLLATLIIFVLPFLGRKAALLLSRLRNRIKRENPIECNCRTAGFLGRPDKSVSSPKERERSSERYGFMTVKYGAIILRENSKASLTKTIGVS